MKTIEIESLKKSVLNEGEVLLCELPIGTDLNRLQRVVKTLQIIFEEGKVLVYIKDECKFSIVKEL